METEFGFLTTLFIGLGILILLFQTIPALLLISGMIKGIFSLRNTTNEE